MKTFILSFIILVLCILSPETSAQWNSNGSIQENIYRSGNVAIGTGSATADVKLFISSTTASTGDNSVRFEAPGIGARASHIHWGTTGDWIIRSASTSGKITIQDNGGSVGIGTATPRGKFDVDGEGDIYLTDDVNAGTAQNLFLPGHIYIAPYNGTDISYLQARRANNSGSTSLRIRTWNNGSITNAMQIEPTGRVGIGVFNPEATLHVHSDVKASDPAHTNINLRLNAVGVPMIRFTRWTGNGDDYHNAFVGQIWDSQVQGYSLALGAGADFNGNQDNATPAIYIPVNGNVGIGTNNPDTKLTVKGAIHTNEVRVDLESPIQGPDYVFEKDYDLLSLAELEAYIKVNKHLPEVPSAKEMAEEGLNLKEMNLLLLKKVEELTLHLIEMNKENAEIADLKKRIELLEKNK